MGFLDKLKEGASKAADMAKETVEVTRLNAQISSKKREMEKKTNQIGEVTLTAFLNNSLDSIEHGVKDLCLDMESLRKDVDQLDIKIREVRNEKDCPCGKTLSLQTKFCSACGHNFE